VTHHPQARRDRRAVPGVVCHRTPLIKGAFCDSVGFSVAGLDCAKFGFYQFLVRLFIVVIVISIMLKTTFSQISIQRQLLVKIL